jgi:hypothetical protein
MQNRNRLIVTFAAGALFAPWVVHADDKKADLDRTPVDCIITRNIDKTDIIDDRTILFYMKGKNKPIYRNYLPSKCPNLESSDRFGYAVTSSRLCKVDLIQALPRIGIPIPCRIGEFTPISADEVEELHAVHDKGRKGSDKIDVKPAEVPKDDAAPAPNAGEQGQ